MQVAIPAEGIEAYKKIVLLRELKKKYDPPKPGVKLLLPNDSEPVSKKEISGIIKNRLKSSEYSVKNIDSAIELLDRTVSSLKEFAGLLDEGMNLASEYDGEEDNFKDFINWKKKAGFLIEKSTIKEFRYISDDTAEQDETVRKKIKARINFKKGTKTVLNPQLVKRKLLIHIAVPDQLFIQLNVPVDSNYNIINIEKEDIDSEEKLNAFKDKLISLKTGVEDELDTAEGFIKKLSKIKDTVDIYRKNLKYTIDKYIESPDSPEKAGLSEEPQLNYGIASKSAPTGLLFNFVA